MPMHELCCAVLERYEYIVHMYCEIGRVGPRAKVEEGGF